MIGERADGWKWAQASGLSLGLHVALLGYLVYQPTLDFLRPDRVEALPQIEVTTLIPQIPEVVAVPAETLTSPADSGTDAETPTAPEDTLTTAPPDLVEAAPAEILPPADPTVGLTSPPADQVGSVAVAGDAGPMPVQASAEAPPPDPRLLILVDRIRSQLTDACLLALPIMRGEDELTLSLLSDSDRNAAALTDELVAGIEGDISRETLLLDPRQCPAVAFARRDARYPVFALGLQLDAQSVSSGDSLRGQISNGAGYVQTLLMVDENGAVHDLRRFLLSSAGATRFDIPVARMRQPRDTRQLLIALATPQRLNTVTARAGDAAGPFFDALFAEVGQNALIGIASFDVR
ncbi:hypothetical protein [Paracoccus xiamenensis]|uniref:hypothetical protein n=1 Tax=Paracoccus xiamenensis TaxID=2714901 RepID=UPI00140E10E0|nr:hypothetical protein [Paracoccus xiamenensis]NHF73862.1 hypothetical protein [Paracoccus xiamenensis]